MISENTSPEEIKKNIFEYIQNKNDTQAVLIDGGWGSGKTFFVQNSLITFLQKEVKDRQTYYFSLYGLNSLQQINSSMSAEILSNEIKKGKTVSTLIAEISKNNNTLENADFQKNVFPEVLMDVIREEKIRDSILIFDDLERCSIPINDLLGYINRFAEHKGCKVIIVANQKEIGSAVIYQDLPEKYSVILNSNLYLREKDSGGTERDAIRPMPMEKVKKHTMEMFSEDFQFGQINEKLIGTIFLFNPSLEEMYDEIVHSITDRPDDLNVLLRNKTKALLLFKEEDCRNLRTLIFALSRFIMLYEKINKGISVTEADAVQVKEGTKADVRKYYLQSIDEEIDGLFMACLDKSLEIKHNKKHTKDEEVFQPGTWYYNRYCQGLVPDQYNFLEDFLIRYKLSENEMLDEMRRRIQNKFFDHIYSSYSLYQLKNWRRRNDAETESALEKLKNELTEDVYPVNKFSEILEQLVILKNEGFAVIPENYTALMEADVKKHLDSVQLEDLTLKNQTLPLYLMRGYLAPIKRIIRGKNEEHLENSLQKFFMGENSWNSDWNQFWTDNQRMLLDGGRFLSIPEKSVLKDFLLKGDFSELDSFYNVLNEVYSGDNPEFYLRQDESILKELDIFSSENLAGNISIARKSSFRRLQNRMREILRSIDLNRAKPKHLRE